ncbi:hypothetical protein FVE85_6761 [Porphyridium purpureum]|uniref:Uncharacterized protein n=1 Tax=Porphyridium purpureum TaxID=35688 RepID=A0A5J4Z668_PORPP|nr:hypothetical protein FVE85_6761 [Porphyridium purpureum]|eukprot:POR1270..scf295_1
MDSVPRRCDAPKARARKRGPSMKPVYFVEVADGGGEGTSRNVVAGAAGSRHVRAQSVAWNELDDLVAFSTEQGKVYVFHPELPNVLCELEAADNAPVQRVVWRTPRDFMPLLVTCDVNHQLVFWKCVQHRVNLWEVCLVHDLGKPLVCLGFTPDSITLVCITVSGEIIALAPRLREEEPGMLSSAYEMVPPLNEQPSPAAWLLDRGIKMAALAGCQAREHANTLYAAILINQDVPFVVICHIATFTMSNQGASPTLVHVLRYLAAFSLQIPGAGGVKALEILPDDGMLYAAYEKGLIACWSMQDPVPFTSMAAVIDPELAEFGFSVRATFQIPFQDSHFVAALAVSNKSKFVLVSLSSCSLLLLDYQTLTVQESWQGPSTSCPSPNRNVREIAGMGKDAGDGVAGGSIVDDRDMACGPFYPFAHSCEAMELEFLDPNTIIQNGAFPTPFSGPIDDYSGQRQSQTVAGAAITQTYGTRPGRRPDQAMAHDRSHGLSGLALSPVGACAVGVSASGCIRMLILDRTLKNPELLANGLIRTSNRGMRRGGWDIFASTSVVFQLSSSAQGDCNESGSSGQSDGIKNLAASMVRHLAQGDASRAESLRFIMLSSIDADMGAIFAARRLLELAMEAIQHTAPAVIMDQFARAKESMGSSLSSLENVTQKLHEITAPLQVTASVFEALPLVDWILLLVTVWLKRVAKSLVSSNNASEKDTPEMDPRWRAVCDSEPCVLQERSSIVTDGALSRALRSAAFAAACIMRLYEQSFPDDCKLALLIERGIEQMQTSVFSIRYCRFGIKECTDLVACMWDVSRAFEHKDANNGNEQDISRQGGRTAMIFQALARHPFAATAIQCRGAKLNIHTAEWALGIRGAPSGAGFINSFSRRRCLASDPNVKKELVYDCITGEPLSASKPLRRCSYSGLFSVEVENLRDLPKWQARWELESPFGAPWIRVPSLDHCSFQVNWASTNKRATPDDEYGVFTPAVTGRTAAPEGGPHPQGALPTKTEAVGLPESDEPSQIPSRSLLTSDGVHGALIHGRVDARENTAEAATGVAPSKGADQGIGAHSRQQQPQRFSLPFAPSGGAGSGMTSILDTDDMVSQRSSVLSHQSAHKTASQKSGRTKGKWRNGGGNVGVAKAQRKSPGSQQSRRNLAKGKEGSEEDSTGHLSAYQRGPCGSTSHVVTAQEHSASIGGSVPSRPPPASVPSSVHLGGSASGLSGAQAESEDATALAKAPPLPSEIWRGKFRLFGPDGKVTFSVNCAAVSLERQGYQPLLDASNWPECLDCSANQLKSASEVWPRMTQPDARWYARMVMLDTQMPASRKMEELLRVIIQRRLVFECSSRAQHGTLFLWGIEHERQPTMFGIYLPHELPGDM